MFANNSQKKFSLHMEGWIIKQNLTKKSNFTFLYSLKTAALTIAYQKAYSVLRHNTKTFSKALQCYSSDILPINPYLPERQKSDEWNFQYTYLKVNNHEVGIDQINMKLERRLVFYILTDPDVESKNLNRSLRMVDFPA